MATQTKSTAPARARRQAKPETKSVDSRISEVPKPNLPLAHRCRQAIPGTPVTVAAVAEMLQQTDLNLVVALITALQRDNGASTPAEEFVFSVILGYAIHEEEPFGMTPAAMQEYVDTFREHFAELMKTRDYLSQHYQGEPQPWQTEHQAA